MSKERTVVLTPEFRLSYPALFEMREYQGKSSYSLTMVFAKGADLTQLKAAAKAALDAKFPNGCKNPRSPFQNGNDRVDEWGESFRDTTYVRAQSKYQPKVVDANRVEILDPDKVYPGCYCRALVAPYAYDNAGNRGVAFSLEAVQFLRDGERLGGGASVSMFDDGTVSGDSQKDPFAGEF